MPSFSVDSAAMLADIIIPLTEDDARTALTWAIDNRDQTARFAVYGPDMDGKPGSWEFVVSPDDDDLSFYVWLNEYHPRKDGKAVIEFGKIKKENKS